MLLKNINILRCLILFLFISNSEIYSQEINLRGNITDTFSHTPLQNAVISLVNSQDSILIKYTYSDKNGNFILSHVKKGRYILQVSFPSYADFIDTVSFFTDKVDRNFGTIALNTKAHLLEDVVVKQRISYIRVKGDTLEYKAGYFKLDANASVQDLLKVLPGIQVNNRGEITANGEKVRKVLVDGEEFFSDDPAVVTQNLRADYVDAVQVYDKKSDQATFTGIDDGENTKTINLKLKADKKLGYFGKIDIGGNLSNYYSGKAMINFFNKSTKVAAYLTKDNTHYQALSFDEQNNFSTNLNMTTTIHDDGTMSMQSISDEFGWGQGYPTSITGGVVYNKKWNQENQKINNTYQYSNLNVDGNILKDTKNILANNTSFYTHQSEDIQTLKIRHLINSIYDWNLGANASLKAAVKGVFVYHNSDNTSWSTSTNNNLLVNSEYKDIKSIGNNNNINISLLFRKKMKKKGRTVSINSDFFFGNQTDKNYLKDNAVFYNKLQDSIGNQNIDQFKPFKISENKAEVKINYTEPLAQKVYAEISYKIIVNHNDALKQSFAKSSGGQYNIFIDSLSNHLLYNTTSHIGSINFKYNEAKLSFSMGTGLGVSNYYQNNIFQDSVTTERFFNILPMAKLDIKLKKQTTLNISYNGLTRNPSILLMQPIKDNSNPLNITIGSPELKQAFINNLSVNYNMSKINRNQFAYVSANITAVNNDFSNLSYTDTLGRTINQAINVAGTYNISLKTYYGLEIAHGIRYFISLNPSVNKFSNIINGAVNTTRNKVIEFETGIQRYNGSNFSFNLNAKPSYSFSVSSIQTDSVLKYWSFESNPNLDIRFPKKIYFSLGGDIHIYEKTGFSNYENIFWINSSIRKFLSKSDSWELRFSVNDIFNQNSYVNRNISSNLIEQSTYSTIKRYFMISVAYHFTKPLNKK